VCALAVLYLNDTEGLDRDHFRWLPLAQLISIGYDTTWLFLLQDMNNESLQEAGVEASVKRFSLALSYVQYVFKFFIFFVLWKVSYNYLIDIKQCPDAPRITKLLKIRQEFSPEAQEYFDDMSAGQSYAQYQQ